MGQYEQAQRSQAERIAGVMRAPGQRRRALGYAADLPYLYPDGSTTIRPREGFRDRGGDGVHARDTVRQEPRPTVGLRSIWG